MVPSYPPELRSLSSFLRAFFVPAAEACQGRAEETALAIVHKANFLEAYSWLDLGVRAGVFPVDAAREVVATYFWLLPGRGDPLVQIWTHLFPAMIARADSALVARRVFEDDPDWSGGGSLEFTAIFELACHSSGSFAMNRLNQELTHVLIFLSRPEFETIMLEPVDRDLVVRALRDGWVDRPKERLLASYIQAIQHMDGFISLFDESRRDPAIDLGRWALFRMSVSALHAWRLNFANEVIDARFDAIGKELERVLIAGADAMGVRLGSGGLITAVEPLKRRWGRLAEPASLQGAV